MEKVDRENILLVNCKPILAMAVERPDQELGIPPCKIHLLELANMTITILMRLHPAPITTQELRDTHKKVQAPLTLLPRQDRFTIHKKDILPINLLHHPREDTNLRQAPIPMYLRHHQDRIINPRHLQDMELPVL